MTRPYKPLRRDPSRLARHRIMRSWSASMGAPFMDVEMQIELLKNALDALDADPELINQVPGP